MTEVNKSFSSDLAAQIEQLSLIKDDEKLSKSEKENKLKEASLKTLEMISKEIDSLSIANKIFITDIQNSIQMGLAMDDWDGIPTPREVRREINDLKQVIQALSQCISQSFSDLNDVMKLLVEISNKYGQAKFSEWLTHSLNNMESAKNQFEKMKDSIKQQHSADQASAVGQIVGGSISLGMSAGSMVGSAFNTKKQLNALKDQKEINLLKDNLDIKTKQHEQGIQNLTAAKKELAVLKQRGAPDTKIKSEESKISALEKMKAASAESHIQANNVYQDINSKQEQIKLKNQTQAAYFSALTNLGGSSSALINGIANTHAADIRQDANLSKLDSDKAEYQKNLDQNMMQSTLDAFQKSSDFVNKVLQAYLNISQNNASMISKSIS